MGESPGGFMGYIGGILFAAGVMLAIVILMRGFSWHSLVLAIGTAVVLAAVGIYLMLTDD